MLDTGLANAGFWDSQNTKYDFHVADQNDPVVQFFEKELPWHNLSSCFEAGCFPGRYLGYFGTKGMKLSGVDFYEKMETGLTEFYNSKQFKIGFLQKADFFTLGTEIKFDIVCSFGFIEHFENWREVMDRHTSLLNNNGYLIITTPNFSGGFQRFFHWHFDRENFLRHYIPSMNPGLWLTHLEQRGYKVIKSGYFGKFDFWVEKSEKPSGLLKKIIVGIMVRIKPLIALFMVQNSKSFSPYCGIIAQKKAL